MENWQNIFTTVEVVWWNFRQFGDRLGQCQNIPWPKIHFVDYKIPFKMVLTATRSSKNYGLQTKMPFFLGQGILVLFCTDKLRLPKLKVAPKKKSTFVFLPQFLAEWCDFDFSKKKKNVGKLSKFPMKWCNDSSNRSEVINVGSWSKKN